MASVYLETTIPSYLTADLSDNLLVAAHQKVTQQWWANKKHQFDLYVSETVVEEVGLGDSRMVKLRRKILKDITTLRLNRDVFNIFQKYRRLLGLAENAKTDLYHIAFAVHYEMDYLLTWNCKHIANGIVIKRLYKVNAELNLFTPLILTPEELLSEEGLT